MVTLLVDKIGGVMVSGIDHGFIGGVMVSVLV